MNNVFVCTVYVTSASRKETCSFGLVELGCLPNAVVRANGGRSHFPYTGLYVGPMHKGIPTLTFSLGLPYNLFPFHKYTPPPYIGGQVLSFRYYRLNVSFIGRDFLGEVSFFFSGRIELVRVDG